MARRRIDSHLEFDESCHTFWIDGRPAPSFTQCLTMAGLTNYDYVSEYYKERGSAVHLATAKYDQGTLDADYLDGEQTGYLEAWAKFQDDHSPVWYDIEAPVYSIPLQVAGIPDRVGEFKSKTAVLEIKTGELYPVTAIQLSLQQACIDPRPERRVAVRLFNDGKYEWKEYLTRDDHKVAMSALTVCHWLRSHKKG